MAVLENRFGKFSSRFFERIAKSILRNDAVFITAGAGIGIDSGLPDFRGNEGLWKAYPYFKEAKMSFADAANPYFFSKKPKEFWFFYGHRYNSYQEHTPHKGFHLLKEICEKYKGGNYFIHTSNVDGHFQRAGFDPKKVSECHGSINHYQCSSCSTIYRVPKNTKFNLDINKFICPEIPVCKNCSRPVRPNILMFGDSDWIPHRTDKQQNRLRQFLMENKDQGITVIELGAGTSVPTIRMASESVFCDVKKQRTLIRINTMNESPSMYGIK